MEDCIQEQVWALRVASHAIRPLKCP